MAAPVSATRPGSVSGSLNRPVHVVFLPPAGATAISNEAALLSADPATDACVRWTTADGIDHAVGPRVLPASGGWPTIAVCDIPRLANVDDLRIGFQAGLLVSTFAGSLTGQSTVEVSNARTLQITADQDNGTILPGLLNRTGRPYQLSNQPPDGTESSTTQPAPSSVGLQTRHQQVGSGGYVSDRGDQPTTPQSTQYRRAVPPVAGGHAFGPIPAALPLGSLDRAAQVAPRVGET